MFERISEELARGGQHDLVGSHHLEATDQGDVGEEAKMKVITQSWEDNLSLVLFENGDQIGSYTALHLLRILSFVSDKPLIYTRYNWMFLDNIDINHKLYFPIKFCN
jgi:hypothetical protein